MDTNPFSLDVIPEMMKLDVEVFRPRSMLVNSGHLESSAVVTSLLHLLQQFHHCDCISEGIA